MLKPPDDFSWLLSTESVENHTDDRKSQPVGNR